MNIEEERKAFEQLCQDAHGFITYPWEVWLIAKQHAEEMAKPQCNIVCDFDGEFWLVSLKGREGPGFASAEEAEVWATSNGYRVIEE